MEIEQTNNSGRNVFREDIAPPPISATAPAEGISDKASIIGLLGRSQKLPKVEPGSCGLWPYSQRAGAGFWG